MLKRTSATSSNVPRRRRTSRRSREYSKSWEYREKNFAREALVINPAKACQPLGAVFAAAGFEGRCPSCMARRAASPITAPTSTATSGSRLLRVDSMTEDAAVFGGQNNMVDGLENAKACTSRR